MRLHPVEILIIFNLCLESIGNPLQKRQDISFRSVKDKLNAPCKTPDNKEGKCTILQECASMRSIGRSNINYIRQATCFYEGFQPVICCPKSTSRVSTSTTEVMTIRPTPAQTTVTIEKTTVTPTENRTNELRFRNEEGCGASGDPTLRIISGQPASLHAWPWMVAIFDEQFGTVFFRCGGSLINRQYILTAAHCVADLLGLIPADRFTVRLGDLDLVSDADGASPLEMKVERIKVHERYDYRERQPLLFDIALMKLSRPVEFSDSIRPICLPGLEYARTATFDGKTPFVIGWGRTEDGTKSDVLRQVQLPVQTEQECKLAYPKVAIGPTHICAGLTQGGKDSCQGDSGGPLMVTDFKRTFRSEILPPWILAGIVSTGAKCAQRRSYGIYTRVTAYIDWISDNAI